MPLRVRPKFPEEWHVPINPKLWITWAHANSKLKNERVYWISTTRPEGKPHAAPVWGIWKENSFYFETAPGSVKGKNLSMNRNMVVHVQDGNDTVIVEGTAHREQNPQTLGVVAQNYVRKYGYKPDWSDKSSQVVFKVDPEIVHAWKTPRMHRTLVKFVF